MADATTFSDERLKTLLRRLDAGEISQLEAAQVLCEHQVSVMRMRKIDMDEAQARFDSEMYTLRGNIEVMTRVVGWPTVAAMFFSWTVAFWTLGLAIGWAVMGRPH